MPNLIGIYDGGSKVVEVNGHPVNVGVLILASVVYGGLIAWIAYRPEIKAALLTIQNLIFG